MVGRVRERFTTQSGVRKDNYSGELQSDWYYSGIERTEDRTREGDNQYFWSEKTEISGGLIHGGDPSYSGYTFYGYPATYTHNAGLLSPLSLEGAPSNGVVATSVIARTNPERASTSGLEYVSELPGLGALAKEEYESRLLRFRKYISQARFAGMKRVAKLHLMIQFGLMPLISDIELLLEFAKRVDARMRELERLRTRGLRRTVEVWRGSNMLSLPGQIMHTSGALLDADVLKTTTEEIRGHIRWYPNFILGFPTDTSQLRSIAKKAILGARFAPDTLYEIFPWSWLIDYYLNLGTMLKTQSNTLPMNHDLVRVMRHVTTITRTTAHTKSHDGRITMDPIFAKHELKTRVLATPTIGARIEVLNAQQWSILGSLAVLRLR